MSRFIDKPWKTFALASGLILVLLHTIRVFATGTLLLNITLAPGYTGPFSPGDEVQYRISFSCNSLQITCGDLLISSSLDPSLQITSLEVPLGFAGNVAGQDIAIQFPNYQDGSAAEALVTVRIRDTALPDVDITTLIVGTITEPDDGFGVVNSSIDIDIEPAVFQWDVQKSLVGLENSSPALDTNVVYRVEVEPDTPFGNLDADTLTIVDTYPANAVVVNATGSPAPTIDTVNNTITWNYSSVSVESGGFSEEVTLLFPSSDFSIGDTILNSVSSTGLPESAGAEVFINEVGNVTTVSADARDVRVTKTQTGSPLGAGGIGRFFLELDISASNVPLEDVVIGDTMPVDGLGTPIFDIVQIISGLWSPAITAEIYICCDSLANEALLAVVDGSSSMTFTPADFPSSFTADDITLIEWRFTDPITSIFELIEPPEIVFTPKVGYTSQNFTNTAFTNVSGSTVTTPNTSDVNIDVLDASTNILPVKNVVNPSAPPNGIIQFEAVLNINEASNQPLEGLAIYDLLPPELEFVSWDDVRFSSGIPVSERVLPNLIVTPVGNRTELIWIWSDTVPAGAVQIGGSAGVANPLIVTEPDFDNHTITVVFSTRVVPNTVSGTYNNTLSYVSNVDTLICQGISTTSTDINDIDGDGVTTDDGVCSVSSAFTVTQAAAMISSEWIQGDLSFPNILPSDPSNTDCPDDGTDTGFTRFPCVAQGIFDGLFLYKMRMQNAGNVPLTDYITYNILPYVGDTGSGQPLVSSARQTAWQAFITGQVTPNDAFTQGLDLTIEYSDSSNPCRPEVSNANNVDPWQPTGTCTDDWTTTPDDFEDVRAYRIVAPFGTGNSDPFFQPAQQMEFLVPMRINGDAIPETIAWNSFAQRARDAISNDLLETSEPRKVGILARRLDEDDDTDDSNDTNNMTISDNSNSAGNSSDLSQSRIIGNSDVTKDVTPYFAQAGEIVTWIVTLKNPDTIPQSFIGFDDSIPSNLSIISVDALEGTVTINGQVVEFRLDTLAPNQVVTVEIVTRINPNIETPFIIDNSLSDEVSARTISVSQLPTTGETPRWRNALIIVTMSLSVIVLGTVPIFTLRSR